MSFTFAARYRGADGSAATSGPKHWRCNARSKRAAPCSELRMHWFASAVRGHLTEYGDVVSKGVTHVSTLIDQIEDPNCQLPESASCLEGSNGDTDIAGGEHRDCGRDRG